MEIGSVTTDADPEISTCTVRRSIQECPKSWLQLLHIVAASTASSQIKGRTVVPYPALDTYLAQKTLVTERSDLLLLADQTMSDSSHLTAALGNGVPDSVIIIGAGIFGLSTALALAARYPSTHVTVVDRMTPPVTDGTSVDTTRCIRSGESTAA